MRAKVSNNSNVYSISCGVYFCFSQCQYILFTFVRKYCVCIYASQQEAYVRTREGSNGEMEAWMWVRREVFIPLMAADQNTVSRQPGCAQVAPARLETTHSAPASSGECLFLSLSLSLSCCFTFICPQEARAAHAGLTFLAAFPRMNAVSLFFYQTHLHFCFAKI
jgi:hypothetical protein